MNKKGKVVMEILLMMIIVVITSAVIFILVQEGVIMVKAEGETKEEILNMDFLPWGREGYLAIKEFKFCERVGEDYSCEGEKTFFEKPGRVSFRFVVESTVAGGEVGLVENYRVKDEKGKVLLEVDKKDDFYFEMKSGKETEEVYFKDYLFVEEEDGVGKYTLELVVENPQLSKKTTLVKEFEVV